MSLLRRGPSPISRAMTSPRAAAVVLACIVVAVVAACSGGGGDRAATPPAGSSEPVLAAPTPPEVAEASSPTSDLTGDPADGTDDPADASSPVIELRVPHEVDPSMWTSVVEALPAATLPSDCPLPLDDPIHLPNSARSYRGGVHQGIDFICAERGREAVAALPGRVVMANNSYVEPTEAQRNALLGEAQALGYTPPWTLALLYGRFVVLDHGYVEGAGHVVTVYAHLDEIDPSITPGRQVDAGTVLGEIGNRGTDPAVSGVDDPRSIHLHWELMVDDVYLGAGLNGANTGKLYAQLFDR